MGLEKALAQVAVTHRDEIEAEVAALAIELETSRQRSDELCRRIAVHEALLRIAHDAANGNGEAVARDEAMTLHEAMAKVLRDSPGQLLRAPDIAAMVNARGLYRMRDGRPVETQQIHARVGHYGHMFQKEGTFIKLRSS